MWWRADGGMLETSRCGRCWATKIIKPLWGEVRHISSEIEVVVEKQRKCKVAEVNKINNDYSGNRR